MSLSSSNEPLPRAQHEDSLLILIEAGAGGPEAARFATELFAMYSRFAELHGWVVELLGRTEDRPGIYRKIAFAVRGEDAYSYLKYETGVDRVQRVPVDEQWGRMHTSTAVVVVMPGYDWEELRGLGEHAVMLAVTERTLLEETTHRGGVNDPKTKIRTYNFPDDRVTDHRIGFNIYGLARILEGYLDPLIDELRKYG